jgi:hypothetical protein
MRSPLRQMLLALKDLDKESALCEYASRVSSAALDCKASKGALL